MVVSRNLLRMSILLEDLVGVSFFLSSSSCLHTHYTMHVCVYYMVLVLSKRCQKYLLLLHTAQIQEKAQISDGMQ